MTEATTINGIMAKLTTNERQILIKYIQKHVEDTIHETRRITLSGVRYLIDKEYSQ